MSVPALAVEPLSFDGFVRYHCHVFELDPSAPLASWAPWARYLRLVPASERPDVAAEVLLHLYEKYSRAKVSYASFARVVAYHKVLACARRLGRPVLYGTFAELAVEPAVAGPEERIAAADLIALLLRSLTPALRAELEARLAAERDGASLENDDASYARWSRLRRHARSLLRKVA